ncbi:hypothetical protein EMIHUDRAFT_105942 [Emiliania huxleyi CCMP1516]|uniref:RING-type domain-containing protein n=2 Tax=Emiliania huxleyi TaxID=2903 RepID=A0A0D3IBC0_EMIH1|nr:hypothetical protein EMIHUDRAFT_105942 [Emiliania huxleyi CCMP1516]EOD08555.1 hypothetical protein EMIHUDRAFT_105942 [Emiliania huxleyi CCMP1516]|eukprot:XP_005760984.1 hypothetical protein EMIHUDRAFT_105942 [Emiliania huxleyi CCMP1516]
MQRIFGRAASRSPRSSGSSSSGARRSSSTERDSRAQRTERVSVVMPAGVRPGMEVQFENPRTGRYFKAAVPPGLLPGQTFIVNVLRSRESSPARGRDVVPVEVSFPSAAASPGRSATSPAQQGGASERERREAAELAEAMAASLAEQEAAQRRRAAEEASELELEEATRLSAEEAQRELSWRSEGQSWRSDGQQSWGREAEAALRAFELAAAASPPAQPHGPGPGLPSVQSEPEASLAEQNAECAVCFDPLHAAPCALFRCGSFRTCRHFLHEACARSLPFPECPLCRCAFDTVQPLPPLLSDPAGWFRAVDTGGEAAGHAARLSRPQEAVVRGLIKTYGLSSDLAQVVQMRENVAAVWALFVDGAADEGDACVTREAFLRPADGLADAIIASRATLAQCRAQRGVAVACL